jgi:SAM-dependent methyltransferase
MRFDWIVCCSTIEHVGWDEEPRDPEKALRALRHLRGLLAADGRMLVTVPLGYNPHMDASIVAGGMTADREWTFCRAEFNRWRQQAPAHQHAYDFEAGHATSLWVGEYGARAVTSC